MTTSSLYYTAYGLVYHTVFTYIFFLLFKIDLVMLVNEMLSVRELSSPFLMAFP